jgi:hypothetical protein
MSDITLMLQAVARGERQASADLLPLVIRSCANSPLPV